MNWKNNNVLVTGGAGFIGSRLVKKLVKKGANVRVIDNLSKGDAHNLRSVIDRIEMVRVDLRSPVNAEVSLRDIDICFHFAARIGGIGYFHRYPATSLRDNSLINLNMWDAAKKEKPLMICVSSSMVFERTKKFPTPEKAIETSPPPLTGYGFSKLMSEYIARTYEEEFGIPFIIARPFNVYGQGERTGDYIGYSHIIPDIYKKIVERQYPLEILGDGRQTRSYTFVDDTVDAMLFLAKNRKALNNDYNIATGIETNVKELASLMWRMMGMKKPIKFRCMPSFRHDVRRRVPDVGKIKALGWKPKYSLEKGIGLTLEWLKKEG